MARARKCIAPRCVAAKVNAWSHWTAAMTMRSAVDPSTPQRTMPAADRHLAFLHRLQQRGLGARAGAVDFIGHQKLGEDRSFDKAEGTAAIGQHVQHLGAEDIGRHQVGGELDALAVQPQHRGQRIDQHRLAQSRLADQQRMTARQDRRENLLHHMVLTDEAAFDAGARIGKPRTQGLNLLHQNFIRSHDNALPLLYTRA